MKRGFMAILVVATFLAGSVSFAGARIHKTDEAKVQKTKFQRSFIYLGEQVAQPLAIWTDDFEGTQPNWIADASWNLIDTPSGAGRTFQPESAWELTDQNSNSPTHSWHAKPTLNEELDFIVSPVIYLPTEVTVEGVTSPLKGLSLDYWLDVDVPSGTFQLFHLLGPAETWWHFSSDNPGAGNSCWYFEPVDIPHWRQWIMTPEIDLTAAAGSNVVLNFMHRYDSEPEFDYYSVDISTDNFQSYTNLAHYDGSNPQPDWSDVQLDLTPWAGQVVRIRFSSKGDYGTAEGYWAIDEISVVDTVNNVQYFYDDGGEAGTTEMSVGGFVPGGNFSGWDLQGVSNPSPNWTEISVDVPPSRYTPGDSVRIAFQWICDGSGTTERGVFVDDVTLYGIGTLPYDVAALGAKGLDQAAVGKTVYPEIVVANVGLQPITGLIRWTGDIYRIVGEDTVKVWPVMFGSLDVTDFARDSVITIPVNEARAWPVEEPGHYLFKAKVSPPTDGDLSNNQVEVTIDVYGPPFQEVLYRCDFEPRGGETSLEDFGFTVVNGGGNDSTGLNNNTWAYLPFIYGDGSALLSWAWGTVDLGPDVVAPYDSSEVLDEYLITPPIDISGLEREATLYMRYYVYFRPSHPAVGPPFGVQYSDFDIDWSIDGGATWHRAYHWEDHDSLATSASRLPHWYYGPDDPRSPLSYLAHLGVDLTPAVRMGGETLLIRFHVWSENSFFVGCDIDNIVVYSGVGHPIIEAVEDVPNDNGKQVMVSWRSSFSELQYIWTENLYGEFERRLVTHYNIWRNSEGTTPKSAKHVSDIKAMLANPGHPGDVYEVDGQYWEFVATVPAHHDPGYSYVAPTLWDGVPAAFMVSAHTNDPTVFVNSNIVRGMSEDNLAPSPPLTVTATQTDFQVTLSWEPSPDEVGGPKDVQYYSIYRRAEGEAFGEPIARVAEHEFVDTSVDTGVVYYYAISATDFAGNEGEKSAEVSLLVSAVAEARGSLPTEFALEQNYPNPFNPTTTISFAVPKSVHVLLEVYNASGQKVATLVNRNMPAGSYTATWDANGMASGVYFYVMKAGEFSASKKMVLMR